MKYPLLPVVCLYLLSLAPPSWAQGPILSRNGKIVTSVLFSTGALLVISGNIVFGHSDALLRDFYDNAAQSPTLGDLNHQQFVVRNQHGLEITAGTATTSTGCALILFGFVALFLDAATQR